MGVPCDKSERMPFAADDVESMVSLGECVGIFGQQCFRRNCRSSIALDLEKTVWFNIERSESLCSMSLFRIVGDNSQFGGHRAAETQFML